MYYFHIILTQSIYFYIMNLRELRSILVDAFERNNDEGYKIMPLEKKIHAFLISEMLSYHFRMPLHTLFLLDDDEECPQNVVDYVNSQILKSWFSSGFFYYLLII